MTKIFPRPNLVFAGTTAFAAEIFKALSHRFHIIALYTQPDRPAGRGRRLQQSPTKCWAEKQQIPVFQPVTFSEPGARETLTRLAPDLLVVVAYGLILPPSVLAIPRKGCINLHTSLLPRWRGAAPIQRAIAAGDEQTGVSVIQMDAGLDTGDILAEARIPITPRETAGTLEAKLLPLGMDTLTSVLESIATGAVLTVRQQTDSGATYAKKISKIDTELNWQLDALWLERLVHALNPAPVAYGTFVLSVGDTKRVRIFDAIALPTCSGNPYPPGTIVACSHDGIDVQTRQGLLRLTTIQLPGERALPVSQHLGRPNTCFAVGRCFFTHG